ncbi:gap-Pol polyprotein [Clonorchis sinensis]|uniref:Gap-Pol polyprotein n=1 Tax=Clonorchis sinensis TaxID=79923 RepID=G7YLN2_CLOSI|nr:gap-Pol polyprotein [Clonorchis sinensis]
MTSGFNTDASLTYINDLFENLIVKKRIKRPFIFTGIHDFQMNDNAYLQGRVYYFTIHNVFLRDDKSENDQPENTKEKKLVDDRKGISVVEYRRDFSNPRSSMLCQEINNIHQSESLEIPDRTSVRPTALEGMRRFKVAMMGPGCDPTVFFTSLQQSLDRNLLGLDGVSRQQLLSDQFVEGVQPALGVQLRLAVVIRSASITRKLTKVIRSFGMGFASKMCNTMPWDSTTAGEDKRKGHVVLDQSGHRITEQPMEPSEGTTNHERRSYGSEKMGLSQDSNEIRICQPQADCRKVLQLTVNGHGGEMAQVANTYCHKAIRGPRKKCASMTGNPFDKLKRTSTFSENTRPPGNFSGKAQFLRLLTPLKFGKTHSGGRASFAPFINTGCDKVALPTTNIDCGVKDRK